MPVLKTAKKGITVPKKCVRLSLNRRIFGNKVGTIIRVRAVVHDSSWFKSPSLCSKRYVIYMLPQKKRNVKSFFKIDALFCFFYKIPIKLKKISNSIDLLLFLCYNNKKMCRKRGSFYINAHVRTNNYCRI